MTTLTKDNYLVPLSAITDENSGNIRTEFDDDSIKGLAASIRAVGLLSPLTVRVDPEQPGIHIITAGHRRYRALQLLVKAGDIVADEPIAVHIEDEPTLAAATVTMLVENLQREDISPLDEARGYLRLVSEFGYKTKDLAAAVGQSVAHINTRLSLVTLPVDLQACVGKTVTIETATKLARIEDEKVRTKLSKQAVKGTLSTWAADHALTEQDDLKANAKIKAWAEKNMLIIYPRRNESPASDFQAWYEDARFTHTELGKATIPKGAVLCFDYRGTTVYVYRKWTKAELAAREAQRVERTVVDNDDDPQVMRDYWDREDAHAAAMDVYHEERARALVHLCGSVPFKTIGKIVLEQLVGLVVNFQSQSFNHPMALCGALGLSLDDHTPRSALAEYIGGSTETALRVAALQNLLTYPELSKTATELVTLELEQAGLTHPGEFTEPEPWQDADGVWHVNEEQPVDEPDEAEAADDEPPADDESEAA